MEIDQLKRKLRELKKEEKRIRFSYDQISTSKRYVWDDYFSTKDVNNLSVKYPLRNLIKLSNEDLDGVFEEYFYSVYFQHCKENGLNFVDIYDVGLLSVFGLNPGASIDDIKKKFRELAKKYHPDHGGDNDKMVELIEAYNKLINKE
ncbi:heat shock protein DnaJ domain-containing protein [Proteiniborus sp. DW1]|uniref:J domain-containing protein n=1 Tax=Proteiniborus sp. DW1 TaxID=1889883 RepID=UPI00092E1E59|nr:J domain-containing protein [Proteiniborus sp. DW1]SCG84371.1 heat shock protein DnaJ domain-containing protein [Proteiniborus sp. DW1]